MASFFRSLAVAIAIIGAVMLVISGSEILFRPEGIMVTRLMIQELYTIGSSLLAIGLLVGYAIDKAMAIKRANRRERNEKECARREAQFISRVHQQTKRKLQVSRMFKTLNNM